MNIAWICGLYHTPEQSELHVVWGFVRKAWHSSSKELLCILTAEVQNLDTFTYNRRTYSWKSFMSKTCHEFNPWVSNQKPGKQFIVFSGPRQLTFIYYYRSLWLWIIIIINYYAKLFEVNCLFLCVFSTWHDRPQSRWGSWSYCITNIS